MTRGTLKETRHAYQHRRTGLPAKASRVVVTSFRLSVFYLLFFLTVGVTLPFLPAYFGSLGLTAPQVGVLLSVSPVFSLFAPPLWGQLADRTGRPGLVLLMLCLGGLFGYSVLLGATTFTTAMLSMALYAVFGSSVTAIIDSLSLGHLSRAGDLGAYGHIRRWGSIGFVAATLVFGYSVAKIDRLTVLVPMAFLAASAAWCALTLARAPRLVASEGPKPSFKAAAQLLQNRELLVLLVATTLHWVASTPYHGSLSTHYTAMGLAPWAIGLTAGVAVSSEVVVMTLWPRWSHRVSARHLLMLAFALSALRWWGMAATSDVVWLTALSALHGFSFGAFYVASVSEVARHVPQSLRSTGQALFNAITFGLGGIAGYSGSGALYAHVGGHQLFAIAGFLELLPLAVIVFGHSRRA